MKMIRDSFGEIRVLVTAEDVRKAVREYKMSSELRKIIDENRRAVVDAAMEIYRSRKK